MKDPSGVYQPWKAQKKKEASISADETERNDSTGTTVKDKVEMFSETENQLVSPTFEASMLAYEDDILDYESTLLDPSNAPRSPILSDVLNTKATTPMPSTKDSCLTSNDEVKTFRGHTNAPHPLLDFALLYHLFKDQPCILSVLEQFYRLHWKVAHPLQQRVPFTLHATWADVLFVVPYVSGIIAAILFTAVFPSVAITGRIARYGLIAALVLAQRNSLFTFVFGVPIDRALFYHKLAGRFSGLAGILHTITYFLDRTFSDRHKDDAVGGAFTGTINLSGSMIILFVIGIVISSLPAVRRRTFEVFYCLHYIFVLGVIISAFFHSGVMIPVLGWLLWGIDLLLRKVVMARVHNPRVANVRIVSDTVVELSFRKSSNFSYNPGQYVYITIPKISPIQSHPFSISSAPSQSNVTLHIRAVGEWTLALYELASRESSVPFFIEGPYGNLSVDLSDDRTYKSVMLISGGIGGRFVRQVWHSSHDSFVSVTPMQSISDQLLHEHKKKTRQLNNLMFVWIERDPILIVNTRFREKSTLTASRVATPRKTVADTLLGIFPQSFETNSDLAMQYSLTNLKATREDLDNSVSTENALSSVLDMRIHLTGANHQFIPGFARVGRPDIHELFVNMRRKAVLKGDERVAVCVSAPRRLRELAQKACVLFSDEKVRFDFHTEVIEE